MKKNKKTAKLMLKETGLKLREVSIQPESLPYMSLLRILHHSRDAVVFRQKDI